MLLARCGFGDGSPLDEKFEVWVRINSEVAGFLHGKLGQENAICLGRGIVVRGQQ
jgi:hypothetical protein